MARFENRQGQDKVLVGQDALRAQVGPRFSAQWGSPRHYVRRLLAEFIGTFGLLFSLSGGAAVLTAYGGAHLVKFEYACILSAISALWMVAAVYCLGDISSHFNPATSFAFALRRDMRWNVTLTYWVTQFAGATSGSFAARELFGTGGNLAATIPQAGREWEAVTFEAILTFGIVLIVLSMADGPKLNGTFIPLAIGAYVMAAGTMGGAYDGAAFNPARAFAPDFVIGHLSTYWVYPLGSLIGACVAAFVAGIFRGAATSREAQLAVGTPLDTGPVVETT